MANELVFAGRSVPVIERDGARYVLLKDLAPVAGYKDPWKLYRVIRRHRGEFFGMGHVELLPKTGSNSRGGRIEVLALDGPGVLKLLMLVRTPAGAAFREWACNVLNLYLTGGVAALKAHRAALLTRIHYKRLELAAAGIPAPDDSALPASEVLRWWTKKDLSSFEKAAQVEQFLHGHKERRLFFSELREYGPTWARGLSNASICKRFARYTKRVLRHRPKRPVV